MFLNDCRLPIIHPHLAILQFIELFKSIGKEALLNSHNGSRFDVPIILRKVIQHELLTKFISVVKGFADTLIIFKNHLPERQKGKKKFSQAALAQDFLGKAPAIGAHNVKNDVETLNDLIRVIGIDTEIIMKEAKSVTKILKEHELSASYAINKIDLQVLKSGVTPGTIKKIANAGLTLEALKKSYMDGQERQFKLFWVRSAKSDKKFAYY
ncbi:uncharacterized protein [Venturia canescens]|uniref:uncharacterized protein n=1 Tax=Venturia canescens TaxID=32260 RepID=UPI001C9BF72F|nr:uncharacterized protein LOC122406192 [Venturia canescens]